MNVTTPDETESDQGLAITATAIGVGTGRDKPRIYHVGLLVAFALTILGLAQSAIELTRGDGPLAALWLPNAVLTAALVRARREHWSRWIISAMIGNIGASVVTGFVTFMALKLACLNVAEAMLAAALFRGVSSERADMGDFGDLWRFALTCGLVAPFVTGFGAALVLAHAPHWLDISLWWSWWLADGLGMLVAGPTTLLAIDAWQHRNKFNPQHLITALPVIGGNALATFLIFAQTHLPLLFLALPMIVVAAFRAGPIGTAASIVAVAFVASGATALGFGPIFLLPGGLPEQIQVLQMFLAASFLVGLPVASALASRERIRAELEASHDFAATVLANIAEVVFRTDADARWTFLNPAWEVLSGYTVAESLGKPATALVHPDDLPITEGYFPRITSGETPSAVLAFRFIDADGRLRHVEVSLRRVVDQDGNFAGTVGNLRDVSAQISAQRALQDSEARFRRLAESAPVGIFRADAHGNITYVNSTWAAKLGLSVAESLGQGWLRALADSAALDQRPAWTGFVPGEIRVREFVFKRADGGEMWAQTVNSAEFDSTGAVIGFVGAVIDITEQRQSQLDLANSKRLFETLASLSPAGIFRTDPAGGCTYVNEAWLRLSGLTPASALGAGWVQAIHPDDREHVATQWGTAVAVESVFRMEFRFAHADGVVRWVEAISQPEFDDQQRLVGYIGVNIDTTDRKRAEEILAEREEQLALLAANATDAVLRIGLDGTCLYASPSVGELAGMAPELLVGRNLLGYIHPDDTDRAYAAFYKLVSGTQDRLIIAYRSEVIGRPGTWMWLESNCGLVRNRATGEPLELIVSSRDVSERKRLEHDLEAARQVAEGAAQAKSSFLANMSHEIRTPMNGVLGFTELLLADSLTPDQRHKVELIADSGKAMLKLLNDILDLSKIDAGQMSISQDALDPRQLVDGCVKLMAPLASGKSLPVDVHVADDVPQTVLGDGLRLRQIILNLLGNAIKFTDAGAIVLTVKVKSGPAGDSLVFGVEDTGIGITPERQGAVLDRYVQAEGTTNQQYGGTGLGLTISAELARLMGGALDLTSAEGMGTLVKVSIPLCLAVSNPALPPKNGSPLQDEPTAAVPALRILVAEDHDINQMLITAMLSNLGSRSTVVPNGAAAVSEIVNAADRGEPYDLVLMDLQMPELDGLEATRRVRHAGIGPDHLPIIALTANAYDTDIESCLDAGLQDHLAKPVSLKTLGEALTKWGGKPTPTDQAKHGSS